MIFVFTTLASQHSQLVSGSGVIASAQYVYSLDRMSVGSVYIPVPKLVTRFFFLNPDGVSRKLQCVINTIRDIIHPFPFLTLLDSP